MKKVITGCLFVLISFFVALLLAPFSAVYACEGSQGGYDGGCITPPIIPPTVITQSAAGITLNSSILKADINPEELNTAAWFEWGASGESLSRVTPDQFIGNGVSFVSIVAPINNLTPNTVYTFRAAAENSDGISYGSTLSFRTIENIVIPPPPVLAGDPPRVTTRSATNINNNSAAIGADVEPRGSATEVWFEWGQSADSLNNQTSHQSAGSGNSSLSTLATLSGLSNNTAYYFRALARNTFGTSYGSTLSFMTLQPVDNINNDGGSCQIPLVYTKTASFVNKNSATLRGSINPKSRFSNAWFEWGRTPALGQETGYQSVGSNNIETEAISSLSQLDSSTTYYFRVVSENNCGRNRGGIASFSTETGTANALLQVVTLPAINITQTSAVMRGQVNPNFTSARAWIEWGTDSNLSSFQTTSPLSIGQGNMFTDVSANPGLLLSNTVYYYRAVADNSLGTSRGSIVSFVTLPFVFSNNVAVSRTASTASFTSTSVSSKVTKNDQCNVSVASSDKVIKTDECGVPIAETENTDGVNTAAVGSYFSGGALLWLLLLSFLIVFLLIYVFYTRYKVNRLLKV
ncbi:MAG: hypothetical protein Q7R75_00010 [bacterium]|nr:hypothetical protein [bacterium]